MKDLFYGTGVALVTPFSKDLQVDYNSLKKLLHHTAQQGVDYYVVLGTTGEAPTVSAQEKNDILNFVKANNPYNLPIVYGIGGNNTADVVNKIENTEFNGIDAILSASPHYNKPSQEGIYQHYQAIADASPVPLILYNVPGRTASNILASTTLKLALHPNIIGIKEASGNIDQCLSIGKYKPENFLMIAGDDMITLPLMGMGASGVISVLANVCADIFKQITHRALEGDFESSRNAAFKIYELMALMHKESNPVGVKQALKVMDICENYVRLPLTPANEELYEELAEVMSKSLQLNHTTNPEDPSQFKHKKGI